MLHLSNNAGNSYVGPATRLRKNSAEPRCRETPFCRSVKLFGRGHTLVVRMRPIIINKICRLGQSK